MVVIEQKFILKRLLSLFWLLDYKASAVRIWIANALEWTLFYNNHWVQHVIKWDMMCVCLLVLLCNWTWNCSWLSTSFACTVNWIKFSKFKNSWVPSSYFFDLYVIVCIVFVFQSLLTSNGGYAYGINTVKKTIWPWI